MSHITTLDVRVTPPEFDKTEQLITCLQQAWPTMTIDDSIDFIFRAGIAYLLDQSVVAFDTTRSGA